MTTPQDPFAPPPPGSTPPAPGVVQPGVVQPGVVQPSTTQPYPGQPFPTQQYGQPEPPKTIARWAVILTGAVTLLTIATSVPLLLDFEKYKQDLLDTLVNPNMTPTVTAADAISLILTPVLVASYVLLALWMHKIRGNLTAIGKAPGGIPAVEWWGWFVPLANFILPALGMRAITRRSVSAGLVLGWWVGFCAYWIAMGYASTVSLSLIDFSTGEFSGNTAALDTMFPMTIVQVVGIAISWVFLTLIIRTATAKHLEA